MKTQTIKTRFTNSRQLSLDARIDIPRDTTNDNKNTAWIIFCHCFTCTKETITTFRLSRLLAEQGYAVLRFDFTGLGGSEGKFSDTTFETMRDDLRSAINMLQQSHEAPAYIMGHSLGGTTALSVADEFDSIRAVVTIASPSQPSHVLHHFGSALEKLENNQATKFSVAGQQYVLKPSFLHNVRQTDMQSILSTFYKPVLCISIEDDVLVGIQNAEQISQWVNGTVERFHINNSDHLLSDRQATEEVAVHIVDWIQCI